MNKNKKRIPNGYWPLWHERIGTWRQRVEFAVSWWRLLTTKNRNGIAINTSPITWWFGLAKKKNGLIGRIRNEFLWQAAQQTPQAITDLAVTWTEQRRSTEKQIRRIVSEVLSLIAGSWSSKFQILGFVGLRVFEGSVSLWKLWFPGMFLCLESLRVYLSTFLDRHSTRFRRRRKRYRHEQNHRRSQLFQRVW